MSNLYRESSIDASYQVSVHLAKRFPRRRFLRNQPIRNKNCLWWPCLIKDQDEISNLYRGPSIDASNKVSSFGQAVSEKIFKNSTNQKQELPVPTMFVNESDRNEQSL